LLAAPELQAVQGRRILLVKGEGGRDLLRETLTSRGAEVSTLETYRREPVVPTAAALQSLHEALETRLIVTATSVEVLDALLNLVPRPQAERVRDLPLVVPGPRVAAAAARQFGWRGAVAIAATAEDDAMLAATVAAAGSRSPAA
jgi:uroporphyrinogen-III synthase